MNVILREVTDADLPAHFEQQRDPESLRMAAMPGRDAVAFATHWAKIRTEPTIVLRTIDVDGEVAGSAVSFVLEGRRQVGYWIARTHWGRGIASAALELLLREVTERPLQARVAQRNPASLRVLQKHGFRIAGSEVRADKITGEPIEGHLLELE
jgi:RimJ/RimL family protein N-acetyltransferase